MFVAGSVQDLDVQWQVGLEVVLKQANKVVKSRNVWFSHNLTFLSLEINIEGPFFTSYSKWTFFDQFGLGRKEDYK